MSLTFDKSSIEKLHGSSFIEGNKVTLLSKGKESFEAIFNRIEKAKRFICLQFYIFRNDETGREIADLLKKKATEGVKIHILYDHFGSLGTPVDFWNDLRGFQTL